MNWITKLERKYGRFCIPNLINILIGGQILVYAIELFVNQYISFYLSLSRSALFAGQIWRLFTFVLVPFSGGGPLSVVLGIYFTWFVGSALEREWGDFRFNLYVLRYLLPVPLPPAGLCHALPGAAGAALLRHPPQGEVFRHLCRRPVGVQLPEHGDAGQAELSALYAGLPSVLRAAGLA